MDIIRFAIGNPVKIAVGVILVVLFGAIAVTAIPVQLTPDVDRPLIRVTTTWPGRSPEEVERSILQEQEEKLKTIAGLYKMVSTADLGRGQIELEFDVNVPITRALQDASNKLDEVPDYPEDVERPVIKASSSSEENSIASCFVQSEDPNFEVSHFYDYFDRYVKPYLERIPGVSEVVLYGGREHQVHIRVDPGAVAARGLTWSEIRSALRADNVNESGGDLATGRLDMRFRVIGQYDSLDDIKKTIIKYDDGVPIRIEDVASVALTLEKNTHFDSSKRKTSMTALLRREKGANVMTIMKEFRKRLAEINAPGGVMSRYQHDRYKIRIRQFYDETTYINRAIGLVRKNLLLGALLAALMLLLFLRSARPTLIIAVAIPISVIGAFVVLHVAGRNINVISLAGLSFAVGMVVDNAIVVLENIDRHLHMGETPMVAAYRGAKEVWGAVFSSTLTTIAVFAPVLTIKEEAGQLFYDIALAICGAVGFSLIVSITVVPAAGAIFLKGKQKAHGWLWRASHSAFGLAPVMAWLSNLYADLIHMLTFRSVAGIWTRVMIIAVVLSLSVTGVWLLMPPASYLPNGNRNFMIARMATPPGYSLEQNTGLGRLVEDELEPYWLAKDSAEATAIQPLRDREGKPVPNVSAIQDIIVIIARGQVFMICTSKDAERPRDLLPAMNHMMGKLPACLGFAAQPSIFGRHAGGSNSVDVEVVGNTMDTLRASAERLQERLYSEFGRFSVRATPQSFELSGPELQLVIDQVRAKELGINVEQLARGVRALIDGDIVGDFNYEGDTIDLLVIRDPNIPMTPEDILSAPWAIAAADGRVTHIPLRQVVRQIPAEASRSIKRVEGQRAITFNVRPPEEMALEQAEAVIRGMVATLREQGAIAPDVNVAFSGNADKLSQTREALTGEWQGWNLDSVLSVGFSRFFLALIITYLLMAALFESFLYPFVIMFSVPMALVGGFVGLAVMRLFHPTQQLDTLTMLGFIILIGIVVNNAILLVHQALNFMRGIGEAEEDIREPLGPREAIAESVKTRMRPIFMTTATSVIGMMPLVVAPGSGSELYRGLGAVVVGGLSVATVFTLLIVPLLFSLVVDIKAGILHLLGREFTEAPRTGEI